MADRTLVDNMAAVWASIETLCTGLSEEEWKTATDCPGWTVQDQLSHLSGNESSLLGRPAPSHQVGDLPHLKNPMGRMNETVVDFRRSWPGDKVLEEFREVTKERLGYLGGLSDDDLAKETNTPLGVRPLRDFLAVRIFDAWVHEQDMRRALGRAGHLEGAVAEHAVERASMAMPMVVGKKVGAGDGTTVVFDITGDAGRTLAVAVEGGRAKAVERAPEPTVRLVMDAETYCCLGCGRWDAASALADGKVEIHGDQELGRRVVEQMNFMP